LRRVEYDRGGVEVTEYFYDKRYNTSKKRGKRIGIEVHIVITQEMPPEYVERKKEEAIDTIGGLVLGLVKKGGCFYFGALEEEVLRVENNKTISYYLPYQVVNYSV
jgi:hypothetical protein